MGKPSFIPDEKTGELIAQWCEQGEDAFDVLRPGSEWYERVQLCTTQKQLVERYNRTNGDVDSNPLLQQLISNRRNEINGKTLNAA